MKTCKKCGKAKPLAEFERAEGTRDGHRGSCKSCRADYGRRYREANGERLRQKKRKYYAANRDRIRAVNDRWQARNRDHKLQKQLEWRVANRERLRQEALRYYEANRDKTREREHQVRAKVLEYYGTACACCCGIDHLEIDHINGGGKEHREEVGRSTTFYLWLIKEGFPDGFQTLCRSCNRSKADGPGCRIKHTVSTQ